MYGHVGVPCVLSGLCLRLIDMGAIFDACMGIEKPDQNKTLARDAFLLALCWDSFHSDTTATRRVRRCVRCLILIVPPILVIYAQMSDPTTESGFLLRT